MTANATHSSVLNIPSLRTKEAPLKMKYEKEKQSNKDECPHATLQEVDYTATGTEKRWRQQRN